MDKYDHKAIEDYWRTHWSTNKSDEIDVSAAGKPYYNLMMFPYPSAEGMHVGNFYAFTASDIFGRFKRMQGFDVFEPIGLDGFGIHSENYALKVGRHPGEHARITEENFYKQLHLIGNMYDWSKTVETYNPNYYRWTQWLFVQLFKAGLAYRASSWVNWCPKCKTVLADEQVIDGKCERCSTLTEKKKLVQWFFKITKYAGRLLKNTPELKWSQKIKTSQINWIGESKGHLVKFPIPGTQEVLEVFTTRIDTLHGVTFLALAPDHPQVITLTKAEKRPEVEAFIKSAKTISQNQSGNAKDKLGVFTGAFVTNPATGKQVPVWITNYVTADYGTGAVMGVPEHDERDREFATKYMIDIVAMKPDMTMEKYGEEQTNYHLRDWLISRQRYWGPPIPMIYCKDCDWQPVPEDQLPVVLPVIDDYQPQGEGKGPLANHPEFYETTCPKCGGKATRETDVSDTFLDSSWYFLRYPSAHSGQAPWDPELTKKWLPVDMYTGGAEHANLHLLYSRFITMAMHDMGHLDFDEPFKQFFAHGMIIKDGAKMSKSKGNVVNPDEYIVKYGADALRLYMMFLGPVDQGGDFRDSGMEGMHRFVNRLYRLISDSTSVKSSVDLDVSLARLVVKMGADIERRHYNTAISALMEFVNTANRAKVTLSLEQKDMVLKVVAPFAPFLAEELYHQLHPQAKSIHTQTWPEPSVAIPAAIETTIIVQINGVMRDRVVVSTNYSQDEAQVQQSALKSAKVQRYLNGAKFRTIFVPSKVINFVV